MKRFTAIIRMSFQALRANTLRSLLTTLGIVIGITTIIAIVSIVEGLNESFSDQLANLGKGVLYVQKYPWANNDWRKFRNFPDVTMKEYNAILAEAHSIVASSPIRGSRETVKWSNHKLEGVQVMGGNEQYTTIRAVYPYLGRNFTDLDAKAGRYVCLLGYDVAEKLFGLRDPIGQHIRVGGTSFEVLGVMSKRGDFFDQNLDQFVLLPYSTYTKVISEDHHGLSIAIKIDDRVPLSQAKDELTGIMRRVRKLPLTEPDNFAINEVDVLRDLYNKLTGGLYAAMFAVAGISLLVGGIGIMNIMLVSVTERTREIGIRKALGARRRWILFQFLFEAMVIATAGGAIGVLFGSLAARAIAAFTPLPAVVKTWSVVVGLVFSSGVGIFFGLFPARAAAKKDPIEALRYE
ncbi:MAG: ABC transporter permease [Myxococcales bacterium]|nr:ABC transporter permease [Myxococcales bacterium]